MSISGSASLKWFLLPLEQSRSIVLGNFYNNPSAYLVLPVSAMDILPYQLFQAALTPLSASFSLKNLRPLNMCNLTSKRAQ